MAYPILAPRDTWYTQGNSGILRSTITEIRIRDTYTPTGPVTAQWDGSAAKDGSITVFVEGTTLTIAGNGSGKVQANADSKAVFSDSAKKDYFKNLEIFDDTDFYTGEVLTFEAAFRVNNLKNIDFFREWDLGKCVNFLTMFRESNGVTEIKLPGMRLPSAENVFAMFQRTSAVTADISGWELPNAIKAGYVFGWSANLEIVNMRGIKMPKVETLSHLFANGLKLKSVDMTGMAAPNVLNYGALYNDCPMLETVDVSMLTAEAHAYSQMFERDTGLKKIIGLDKLRTRLADNYQEPPIDSQTAFTEFLSGCENIEELDLSNIDTRMARKSYNNTMANMLTGMLRLRKVTLGPNFDWTGGMPDDPPVGADIPALPTPDPTYIPGADGHWYDKTGKAYTPEEAIKMVPNTYYASKQILYGSEPAIMDRSQMREIAEYVRQATGKTELMKMPDVFKAAVDLAKSGDISLGMTGATVGQIARIKAVGPDGQPTEWEPVDMPSGDSGGKYELLVSKTLNAVEAGTGQIEFTLPRCRKVMIIIQSPKNVDANIFGEASIAPSTNPSGYVNGLVQIYRQGTSETASRFIFELDSGVWRGQFMNGPLGGLGSAYCFGETSRVVTEDVTPFADKAALTSYSGHFIENTKIEVWGVRV